MRWVIIGHSGTQAGPATVRHVWPELLGPLLTAKLGEPSDVRAFRFWPAGPTAVDYAMSRVNDLAPDAVVLGINHYPCVVPLVSESVRRRFGVRAERLFKLLERQNQGRSKDGGLSPYGRFVRRLARRVLGATVRLRVEDSAATYSEILERLAQREGIEVFVLAEAHLGSTVRALHPRIDLEIGRLHAPIRAIAESHRIPWLDAQDFVAADGDAAYFGDHVHLSELGNERYAAGIAAAAGARAHPGTG